MLARQSGISLSSVQYWIRKAQATPLARVDFDDAPTGPKCCHNRTESALELDILALRRQLAVGPLGDRGATAIHLALSELHPELGVLPCVRTIGRILERHGLLDGRQRVRRPPPPRGWYLPGLGSRQLELDSFDGIDGLTIQGGAQVEVLTAVSHWGGLPACWPVAVLRTDVVLAALQEHWRIFGLPAFAQFDNGTIFQGAHQYADTFSRVVRFCLQLAVVPVFAPPRETGFQAQIESFNARWQEKVWDRFAHLDLPALQARNTDFVAALRHRSAQRIEAAPSRRPWPSGPFAFAPKNLAQGRLIFLRRTNESGQAFVLGRPYDVDPSWQAKLVRAELDLHAGTLHFCALRRQQPAHQPLLKSLPYLRHKLGVPHPFAQPDLTAKKLKLTAKNR